MLTPSRGEGGVHAGGPGGIAPPSGPPGLSIDFAKLGLGGLLGGGSSAPGTGTPVGGIGQVKKKVTPGTGGTTGTTDASAFTNTAKMDPRLDFLGKTVENRLKNPTDDSKRAIDTVGLAMRDLESGQEKELGARFAQQGVSGSGIETSAKQQLQADTAGKVAGAATDITMQRARDNDQFMLGAGGALGAAGDANRADRDLASRVWIQNEQNKRAQEQAALAQQLGILNLLGNLGAFGG